MVNWSSAKLLRKFNEERIVFSTNSTQRIVQCIHVLKKAGFEPFSKPYTKISSKLIIYPNIKVKTIKLLEGNIGEDFMSLG